MGGCNIDTAFSRADSDFSMSLLKNWRTLVAHNPDFALDEGGASKYPAIAAAIATYESALSDWKEVCEKRTARDKNKYHTVRGGYLTEFYPKSVPLPEPESLPATDAILNGTCKSTYPRPRALAAIKNHKDWYAHQELVKARDVHVKNNPSLGDSAVNNREAARFVSASTPFAGKAFDVRVDGTYATALSSDTLQDELQRKLGLWLSAALPTLRVALERGMPVDFFGDYLYNKAHHRRPHDGVLAAWADAMRAPANAPVVHGDKEKPELTRQYNEGYKVDLAEPQDRPRLRQGASRFLPRRDLCQAQQLQPAAPRDVRRRLLAHRRSQAAPPRAQSRARQRRPHGLLAQVLALFYVPPCRAHLSLCCARREPRHSLSPGNPVCTSRARVNRAPGPKLRVSVRVVWY